MRVSLEKRRHHRMKHRDSCICGKPKKGTEVDLQRACRKYLSLVKPTTKQNHFFYRHLLLSLVGIILVLKNYRATPHHDSHSQFGLPQQLVSFLILLVCYS